MTETILFLLCLFLLIWNAYLIREMRKLRQSTALSIEAGQNLLKTNALCLKMIEEMQRNLRESRASYRSRNGML